MLGDFFLCDLTLSLENLHHLDENFQFNVVWHRKSVAALLFYRTLAESIITVIPSVTCKNSVALVRERTIPTEQPPLVGEVSANFCG